MSKRLKVKVTRSKLVKLGEDKPIVVETTALKADTVKSNFDLNLTALMRVPPPNKKSINHNAQKT